MKPDILQFFTYRNRFGFGYKFTNRVFGIQSFFRGDISFRETISFLLPGSLSKDRQLIWTKMFSRYINDDGSVNLYGNKFYIPHNNFGDFAVLVQQIIIDDQYRIKQLLKEDACIIDGGANMGVFSVFVAHHYPRSTIYAFEPAMETFNDLKRNNAPYSNVHVFSVGLGDEKTERSFQIYTESSTSNHFISPEFATDTNTVTTPITTIDDFVTENGIKKVDYIKLDTEGYEGNILKGAPMTIQQSTPIIVMSAYHKPTDKVELPQILTSIHPGYVCELHSDNEEDFVCSVK